MSVKPYTFRHDGTTYTFCMEPDVAEHASQIAGRKVYKDYPKCKAMIPSLGPPKQANSDLITPDWLAYKDGEGRLDYPGTVFRDHYEKWMAGQHSGANGTPLSNLPELTPAMVKTLEASKIDTLEVLAQMNPSELAKALGPTAHQIVEKAKALTAEPDPDVQRVREENTAIKTRMETQELQMQQMREQIAALTAKGGKATKTAEAA